MLAWWPGDGDVTDFWENYNGIFINSPSYTIGKVDQCFHFTGSNWVQVNDQDVWTLGTSPFTIDLWVKFDYILGRSPFIAHDEAGGPSNKWIFWYDAGGHRPPYGPALRFHIYNPSVAYIPIDTIVYYPWNPVVGVWYHVAVTREGFIYNLYIDGVNVKTEDHSYPLPNPNAPLTIGKAEAFTFRGDIDEVEIFNRALTSLEVKSIYEAGSAGKCKIKVIEVQIDIKPGSDPNCINLDANGVIPVAILTTAEFDASTVDPLSVMLEGAVVRVKGKSGRAGSLEDIDGDGDIDLMLQVNNETTLQSGNSIATLTGMTYDGLAIEGKDQIEIVPSSLLKGYDEDGLRSELLDNYILYQNFPNPFNQATFINFYLPQESSVHMAILSLTGTHINTLIDGMQFSGYNRIAWDGRDDKGELVPSGIYICRMVAGAYQKIVRMVLLK
jgi:hypothetical protein